MQLTLGHVEYASIQLVEPAKVRHEQFDVWKKKH